MWGEICEERLEPGSVIGSTLARLFHDLLFGFRLGLGVFRQLPARLAAKRAGPHDEIEPRPDLPEDQRDGQGFDNVGVPLGAAEREVEEFIDARIDFLFFGQFPESSALR